VYLPVVGRIFRYFIPKFHILETGTVKLSIETDLTKKLHREKPGGINYIDREIIGGFDYGGWWDFFFFRIWWISK
jgi:hypothetical protein